MGPMSGQRHRVAARSVVRSDTEGGLPACSEGGSGVLRHREFLVPNRRAYRLQGPTHVGMAAVLASGRRRMSRWFPAGRWSEVVRLSVAVGSDVEQDLSSAYADGAAVATFARGRAWPLNLYIDSGCARVTTRVVYDEDGNRANVLAYRQRSSEHSAGT